MTATKKQIEDAVRGLAPEDDANWTQSGLPNVDAVSAALGERVSREDITGATSVDRASLQKVDAGSELARAQPAGDDPANYRDSDGPDPDAVWAALDMVATAASSPRFRRNQVLQQIRLLWANEEKTCREAQNKMEGRIERREAKRDERRERAEETDPQA